MQNVTPADLSALSQRLSDLETRNRRLWLFALGCGILATLSLTVGVVAASRPPSVIEAGSFVLKDFDGSRRGEWFIDAHGDEHLILRARDGHVTAELPFRVTAGPATR